VTDLEGGPAVSGAPKPLERAASGSAVALGTKTQGEKCEPEPVVSNLLNGRNTVDRARTVPSELALHKKNSGIEGRAQPAQKCLPSEGDPHSR
jgi:hypothetical protein